MDPLPANTVGRSNHRRGREASDARRTAVDRRPPASGAPADGQAARKFIFGTDWPGVPGVARNARALADLDLDEDVLAGVLAGNAINVYPGLANVLQTIDVTPY
jgi:Amidohydrolase